MIWGRLSGLASPIPDPLGPLVPVVWCSPVAPDFVQASVCPHGFIQDCLQLRHFRAFYHMDLRVSRIQVHLGVDVSLLGAHGALLVDGGDLLGILWHCSEL